MPGMYSGSAAQIDLKGCEAGYALKDLPIGSGRHARLDVLRGRAFTAALSRPPYLALEALRR